MFMIPGKGTRLLLSVVIVLLILASSLHLALAAGEQLTRTLIGSMGGSVSQEGYTLNSAVGQPVVGAVTNDSSLCSGFLCGPGAPETSGSNEKFIYLPVVLK